MPSLGSILSIARSALRTHQQAVDVTAHNIANATTDGYSRQEARLSPLPPVRLPEGVFGAGVSVVDVDRVRDTFTDATYRRENAAFAGSRSSAQLLADVEALLGEVDGNGLGSSIDALFSAFSELATHPADTGVRTAVQQAGLTLAARFNTVADGLDAVRQSAEDRLVSDVGRINDLASQIADLNRQIVSAEVGGTTAGDLRDSRDRAIDALSGLVPVQVVPRTRSSVGVLVNGVSLVDGAHASTVEIRNTGGTFALGFTGRSTTLTVTGGSTGGTLDFLNGELPTVRTGLDGLAAAIVGEVNTIHRTGTNPAGNTGIDFFDPAGAAAGTMQLSADVSASVTAISAGTPDGTGAYQAGANDVALALAGLRDVPVASLGGTFGESHAGLVVGVGSRLAAARQSATAQEALTGQADLRRNSVHGVSTDEEMVKLIQFQTAYQAAARVITTADEMLQTLVNL